MYDDFAFDFCDPVANIMDVSDKEEFPIQGADENKWTPSASFEIYINNPEAMNTLAKRHEFYVDFAPVGIS